MLSRSRFHLDPQISAGKHVDFTPLHGASWVSGKLSGSSWRSYIFPGQHGNIDWWPLRSLIKLQSQDARVKHYTWPQLGFWQSSLSSHWVMLSWLIWQMRGCMRNACILAGPAYLTPHWGGGNHTCTHWPWVSFTLMRWPVGNNVNTSTEARF